MNKKIVIHKCGCRIEIDNQKIYYTNFCDKHANGGERESKQIWLALASKYE